MALDNSQFQKRLKAALGDMRKGAVKGIKLACAHIKREAQQRTPVDEGNLKGSAYTEVNVTNRGVVGEIGFTAEYAAAVHEKPMIHAGEKRTGEGAKGRYWDRQGKATNKFLEKAFDENQEEIATIIQKSASL